MKLIEIDKEIVEEINEKGELIQEMLLDKIEYSEIIRISREHTDWIERVCESDGLDKDFYLSLYARSIGGFEG